MTSRRIVFVVQSDPCAPRKPLTPSSFPTLESAALQLSSTLNHFGLNSLVRACPNDRAVLDVLQEVKPHVVMVESLWLSPRYVQSLMTNYPHIRWIVRVSSDTRGLVREDGCVTWLLDYLKLGVELAFTATAMIDRLTPLLINLGLRESRLLYLPDVYTVMAGGQTTVKPLPYSDLHVGLFGDITAGDVVAHSVFSLIDYTGRSGRTLHLHVSANQPLCTMRALASRLNAVKLIEHAPVTKDDFYTLLKTTIHAAMDTASHSVSHELIADAICCGVPVVTSSAIPFVGKAWSYSSCDTLSLSALLSMLFDTCQSTTQICADSQYRQLKEHIELSLSQWICHFG